MTGKKHECLAKPLDISHKASKFIGPVKSLR